MITKKRPKARVAIFPASFFNANIKKIYRYLLAIRENICYNRAV